MGPYGNGSGFGAPTQYEPAPQPKLFIPSQILRQILLLPSYHIACYETFIPSTPPVLRNAEQYQQSTFASQLYPVYGWDQCNGIYASEWFRGSKAWDRISATT